MTPVADDQAVGRELASLLVAAVLREARTEQRLAADHQRLTWRATAPLRSMGVARLLARVPGRFQRAQASIEEPEVLARWRSSPEYWDALRELRGLCTGASVGVLLHLHYPELWEPMRQSIAGLPGDVRVLVTATPSAYPILMADRDIRRTAEVVRVANVGRDMGAFFTALDLVGDRPEWRGCDAILRLHGKRSPHLRDGGRWRDTLVGGLVRSAPAVLRGFATEPRLAMAGDLDSPRRNTEVEIARGTFATRWEPPQGFSWDAFRAHPFPVGGMFWFRPEMIDELRALHVDASSFEGDARDATDGQTPHLLERIVGWWPEHRGFRVADAISLMDEHVVVQALEGSPERGLALVRALTTAARSRGEVHDA